ncbi:MAG: zinc ABC transporter substrate-binding protein ZnuA [Magnetococcales bacterium]|nr:zinc ABC transporter substrate-binding protein ZnuA [Magnetococcales bacterium]
MLGPLPLTILLLLLALPCHHASAAPSEPARVVVSIQPLHALVSGVTEGISQPHLLVRGGASPHAYALRPSDARAMQQADVVFWIGNKLEVFLEKSMQVLPNHARVVELAKAPGIQLLPFRAGGRWNAHHHDDHRKHHEEHHEGHHETTPPAPEPSNGHHHAGMDMHIWLDTLNAKVITSTIAHILSKVDPSRADRYQQNAQQMQTRLDQLHTDLKKQMAPLSNRPYIVFHDAYHHFEARYGLTPTSSVTISPDRKPGVKRLYAIREQIKAFDVTCIFQEPQFKPSVIRAITQDSQVKVGILDPLGSTLKPGVDAYFTLMRNLGNALDGCLAP